jgi:ATP-dependent RNA helicase SUPV3L1/SUV3
MAREPSGGGRIVAVLGPTNTGKTHFAVERMLAHSSGMIGFPLRLLAREVYDRIVALRGPQAVALMTGEEKLGSDSARYIVATVEAMPLHRRVAFLAVDEIQLCADYERGHIFTDRLLKARGLDETMFLGSDTIRPLLKLLVPSAEIITRPRFSVLRHAGHSKLNRLPRRSAIVAFTAADVYSLGELIRRQRGGAAIVLGALSPRTRNAQVAMYQAGEVEHLVATDAIGMGLNMDLGHVAFAELRKFDGRSDRRLTAPEIAQIAGRAGRHMADGTFGTTNGAPVLDDQLVHAVEGHVFPALKALRWRSSDLDFGSLESLAASLDARPPARCLVKVRDALDDRCLGLLGRRPEIRERADRPERIRLLWQVCQIPDFNKTLSDAHLQMLAVIYGHLTAGPGRLPTDWVARMIARLDDTEGDVDALVGRIAHVRTWTYLTHRTGWLEDAPHWQARAREVEDRLSDALHERLAQRFVDRRTTALLRSLREKGDLLGAVESTGLVQVDGHQVGELEGLTFRPSAGDEALDRRVMLSAARRIIGPELGRRAILIAAAGKDAFQLDDQDRVLWGGAAIARLVRGAEPRRPRLELIAAEELSDVARSASARRLEQWLDGWTGARIGTLVRLAEMAGSAALAGPARGIAYVLAENLGSVERARVESLLRDLDASGHGALTRLGVRFGRLHLYLADQLKPAAVEARGRLWRIWAEPALALPVPGRTVLRGEEARLSKAAAMALGFAPVAEVAVRVDVLERLAAGLRAKAKGGSGFGLPIELAAAAGLSRLEFEQVVEALGYRPRSTPDGLEYRSAGRRRPASGASRSERTRPFPNEDSPFAALAALKAGR